MTVEEVAGELNETLRRKYNNIQAVGIRQSNSEAYKANPKAFASEITEDSIIVYTTNKPTKDQLAMKEHGGFKIKWKKSGRMVCG